MLEVIIDTSALIAFFVGSEKHHKAIRDYFFANPKTKWVIISTVFDETVTWLRVKVSIKDSITIGHLLRNEHRYIALSEMDDTCVWESFQRYNDKTWSYTDCSLLVMSQRLEIPTIVSFDEHIRQMSGLGVNCVPLI